MKANKTGFARIFAAFFYSADGMASAFKGEAAFRQELLLYIVLLPILYFLPVSLLFKCLLFAANTLVLIVELLNSAVESIVDLVSPDYNIYAKQAKDMGSAAVLLSLLLAAILWACALYTLLG
ncbi:MAG: diacylglycerol kinase [Desulfoprunum sp.]|nr:diacylglycerol kinase [Desulfoprunum sp.]